MPRCRASTRWTRSSSASSCSASCRSRLAKALWLLWPAWVCVRGHRRPETTTGSTSLAGFVLALLHRLARSGALFTLRAAPRMTDEQPRVRAGSRQPARPRQAGVHAGGTRDPAALDARGREDEADPGHAHARRRLALPRGRGARRLRAAKRSCFFWLGGVPLRRRLRRRHPRRCACPRREQGHRLRRLSRLDVRSPRRGGDARRRSGSSSCGTETRWRSSRPSRR